MSRCSSLIDSKLGARQSAGDANRQGLVALDEARIYPLGLADHLNFVEPLQDFFPDYLQLKLGQSEPNAPMNTEAEGDVGTRPGPVNDEVVRTLDDLVVAVARDVPHHDLVIFLDLPATELDVLERGPAHMRQWRLPADHLRHETVDQRRILAQLAVLIRIFVQCIDAARQCVARGIVVATSDQLVSLRRSSQGKSNSTASIWVVSSIETLSTQSNTSFFGRLSRHSADRCRMLVAS